MLWARTQLRQILRNDVGDLLSALVQMDCSWPVTRNPAARKCDSPLQYQKACCTAAYCHNDVATTRQIDVGPSHQGVIYTAWPAAHVLTCRLRSCSAFSLVSRSSLQAEAACSRSRCASASARSCARFSISARRCAVSVRLKACSSLLQGTNTNSMTSTSSRHMRRDYVGEPISSDAAIVVVTAGVKAAATYMYPRTRHGPQ